VTEVIVQCTLEDSAIALFGKARVASRISRDYEGAREPAPFSWQHATTRKSILLETDTNDSDLKK
jgi:hypothetical protein